MSRDAYVDQPILLALITFISFFFVDAQTCTQGVDLTLVAETNGTAVVEACIAKITQSGIFTDDNQLLRRIAFTETRDGEDSETYRAGFDGGIWQLNETQFQATKTLNQQTQAVNEAFGVNWIEAQWSDLRKPFYSALAARLYFFLISQPIPFAFNVSEQGTYWESYYTSSNGTVLEFTIAVNQLGLTENCSVSGIDLYFVMDESGSIGSSNFEIMRDFVSEITSSFDVGPDDVRIGVLTFSDGVTFEFYLNTYSTKDDVLSAIENIAYNGGGTNTAAALDAIGSEGFTAANGARPESEGIPRIMVVITDGHSNSMSATAASAQLLHDENIIVFAIGISGANVAELEAIASQPAYVSFLEAFDADELSNLQIMISGEACEASVSVNIGNTLSSILSIGETKYFNYLTADTQGLTIALTVNEGGAAVLFVSTVIQTPNEALYDLRISTDEAGKDAFLNPNVGSIAYVCVKALSNDVEISVSTSVGNTGTSNNAGCNVLLQLACTLIAAENPSTTVPRPCQE